MDVNNIVGIIPAAGEASRIAPLPCSKEIYPVGLQTNRYSGKVRPKVSAQYLIEKMRQAGAKKAYVIIRKGKWDIPGYFGNGSHLGIDLAYLLVEHPYGAPYSVDQAFPFAKDATVLFGFPDILFEPNYAFTQLLCHLYKSDLDIVLGLYHAHSPQKEDMIVFDEKGKIIDVLIKPDNTSTKFTWIIAAWTPVFSKFLHNFILYDLKTRSQAGSTIKHAEKDEIFIGDAIRAAISERLKVGKVFFLQNKYIDIGTPENLIIVSNYFKDFFSKTLCEF
jgi:glucose-1-phosphate thymidylyltransferase